MRQLKKIDLRSVLIFVCLIGTLGMVCPGKDVPVHKFMATVGANVFSSASGAYRQIYGQSAFMPEFKLTRLVYRGISVWGGFGYFSDKGNIEEVDEKASFRRTLFGFGLGYVHKLSALLRLRGELGLTSISFKEEALGMIQKGSGLGWKIGANVDYFIGERLFATLMTAYSQASDKVQTGTIKLGGFQGGLGLGFTFR